MTQKYSEMIANAKNKAEEKRKATESEIQETLRKGKIAFFEEAKWIQLIVEPAFKGAVEALKSDNVNVELNSNLENNKKNYLDKPEISLTLRNDTGGLSSYSTFKVQSVNYRVFEYTFENGFQSRPIRSGIPSKMNNCSANEFDEILEKFITEHYQR